MKATVIGLFVIIYSVILAESSHNPKMKVDFGINLPSMSFNLPGMALPKMRITAVVNKSKPKKPMKIELPAISLSAKSLEDPWGQGGGGYDNGWNGGGGGGEEYSGGGEYSNGGGGYDNNAYSSENEEEYSEDDGYDEDGGYENQKQGQQSGYNNQQPAQNSYGQAGPAPSAGYGQQPAQQQGYPGNNYQSGAPAPAYGGGGGYSPPAQPVNYAENSVGYGPSPAGNPNAGYGPVNPQQVNYGGGPQRPSWMPPGYNGAPQGHPPPQPAAGGYDRPNPYANVQTGGYASGNPGYTGNQEYNHQVLKYGPPRPDQDAKYGQEYAAQGYPQQRQGNYGSQGGHHYGKNYAEHKELIVYGKTPKKIQFVEDKPYHHHQPYHQNYHQANPQQYARRASNDNPTVHQNNNGYRLRSSSLDSQSTWKPMAGSSYYGYP